MSMKSSVFAAPAIAIFLTGCSFHVQMMPRDNGKIYTGSIEGNGFGSGTMKVDIDGTTFAGPLVRTSSNESFGFIQTYGGRGAGSFATASSASGSQTAKAILSSFDNHGLRCDLVADGGHGGGICVDDQGRAFDVLLSR